MPRGRHPENVSPYTGLRVPVCKGTYIHARRGRVDGTRVHNGNSTLRQSYTQKPAYRWWRMAYFSHSARTTHGTPPLAWGCQRLMCTNSGAFRGLLGAVRKHIVEFEGPRGPLGTGKSSAGPPFQNLQFRAKKCWPNAKHHDGAAIFPHFARACCLLA